MRTGSDTESAWCQKMDRGLIRHLLFFRFAVWKDNEKIISGVFNEIKSLF
jgi:hypothetical protein